MTDGYVLREATPADAFVIAVHRAWMFFDMGAISQDEMEPLIVAFAPWIKQLIEKNEYVAWLIHAGDDLVASGGVYLRDLGPGPGCLKVGRWAHIANVYTVLAHRRRGLARRMMGEALRWCATRSIDQVTLTASGEGRRLYESLGFVGTEDMKLVSKKT